MLRQYSKAIGYLIQPHSSPRSRASTRVALVTCVVFIYLELLRGHYRAAQTHLENGLKLLEEIKLSGIFKPQQLGESTDGSIIEAFFRVCVQAQLLIQPSQQLLLSLRASELEIPTRFFESIDQARQHLYLLLNEIFNLTKLAKQQPTYNAVGSSLELVDHQRRIQAELASWLEIHKASRSIFLSPSTIRGTFAYELLSIYHIMATIMCHTCLSPYSSYIYDSHASSFTSMIMKSIYLQKSQSVVSEALHGHAAATDKSKAIIDMGWIPPLYYIAIKCRTHRIRLQAVKFLESTGNTHKEGIWDSSIAACVARKVMEVEERDFYRDLMVDDDFKFCNPPEEKDFLVPVLPDEYRIHDVQVVLPDDPMGKILLSYRRGQNDCSWEYDMLSECWTDTGKINEQEEMANPERDLNLREGA
jgi:hypothetical protein